MKIKFMVFEVLESPYNGLLANFVKHLIIILISVSVSSCVTPRYVAPTSGPTAEITFPVLQRGYSVGGVSTFGVRLAIEGEDGCGRLTGSPPDEEGGRLATVVIPANKKIFLLFEVGVGNSGCNVVGSFYPAEGEKYHAVETSTYSYCGIGLVDSNNKPVKLESGKLDLLTGQKACNQ